MGVVHKAAFINEIVGILKNKEKKDVVVDGTCGTGSHTLAILQNFSDKIKKFFCIDIDSEILEIARKRIKEFVQQCSGNIPEIYFLNDNFKNLKSYFTDNKADIIILDLGVSQYHLKTKERGFSFDSPIVDMRYDKKLPQKAIDVIKNCSKEELENIFSKYADIKKPSKLIDMLKKYIISENKNTTPLGKYLQQNLRKIRGRLHPATLIFQALRIYINNELDNIESFLKTIPDTLNTAGLLFVVTYHSIEDRLVKNYFKNYSNSGKFSLFNKKVIKPTFHEVLENRYIRSAKLRILYRDENEKPIPQTKPKWNSRIDL